MSLGGPQYLLVRKTNTGCRKEKEGRVKSRKKWCSRSPKKSMLLEGTIFVKTWKVDEDKGFQEHLQHRGRKTKQNKKLP